MYCTVRRLDFESGPQVGPKLDFNELPMKSWDLALVAREDPRPRGPWTLPGKAKKFCPPLPEGPGPMGLHWGDHGAPDFCAPAPSARRAVPAQENPGKPVDPPTGPHGPQGPGKYFLKFTGAHGPGALGGPGGWALASWPGLWLPGPLRSHGLLRVSQTPSRFPCALLCHP